MNKFSIFILFIIINILSCSFTFAQTDNPFKYYEKKQILKTKLNKNKHSENILFSNNTKVLNDEKNWEFESPEYPYESINDLWHAPNGDLWAVCSKGLVFVYEKNAQKARQIQTNIPYDLNSIWGTDSNNVYIAGNNGIVLYYNGIVFQQMQTTISSNLFAIWGTESGYLVAGGESHTIIQRAKGSSKWIEIKKGNPDAPDIYAIWGTGEHHVFAVGGFSDLTVNNTGIIDHYNGHEWYTIFKQENTTFTDIWGMSDLFIRVCGSNINNKGVIAYYNGFKFNSQEINSAPIQHILGIDQNFIIASVKTGLIGKSTVGLIANNKWKSFSDSPVEQITAMSGKSIFDIKISGKSGALYSFEGQSWKKIESSLIKNLNSIWGSDERNLFAVGDHGAIYQSDGLTWTEIPGIPDIQFNDVFGLSDNEVYAVGQEGAIFVFNGHAWIKMLSNTTKDLYAIWGYSPDNLYAVGQSGIILKHSGDEWIEMTSPTNYNLYDISSTIQDTFAVGANGMIIQLKNYKWQYIKEPSVDQEDLLSIWGDPDSLRAFTVGLSGTAFEFQGQSWENISAIDYKNLNLNCVSGFSSDQIISSSSDGKLLIYNGITWTLIQLNTSAKLNAIWNDSFSTIKCVGSYGTILRYATPLTLNISSPLSEGEALSANVRIFPKLPLPSPLNVYLKANPINELEIPSQLTIPSNEYSIDFNIQVYDDIISDGAKSVNIYATAPGYHRAVKNVEVMDSDDNYLALQLPEKVNEFNILPVQGCTVSLSKPAPQKIDVLLHSDMPEQLNVPEIVSIPAGYTYVEFSIAPIDDLWLDGSKFVNIIAMVPGWAESVSKTVQVMDNEEKVLSINGPIYLSEEKNFDTIESWITLSAIPEQGFFIDVSVDKPTELSIAEKITVMDGQQIIPVEMKVIDDQIIDGSQEVLVSISAPGWQESSYTLTIKDNDPGLVQFAFDNYYASENNENAIIELIRTESDSGAITIMCSTYPGSAQENSDYTPLKSSISFESGENYKVFTIPIVQDNITESKEFFEIQLSEISATNNWVGDRSSTLVYIQDDEWQTSWQNPIPQGNSLNDIEVISDNLIIAVGDNGLIMNRSDSEWIIQNKITEEDLNDIFVLSQNNVYAVGNNGTILFFDGSEWSRLSQFTSINLNAISGVDNEHLIAVGDQLMVYIYNGNEWYLSYEGNNNDQEFNDVWAYSEKQVFIVGGNLSKGVIYHWDGNYEVSPMIIPECTALHCVWGTSPKNVYAAGDSSIILHYDGTSWQKVYQSEFSGNQSSILSLWGKDEQTIYAVGGNPDGATILKKVGNKWERQIHTFNHWLNGVSGWSDRVVAVGVSGIVVETTIPENSWTKLTLGQTSVLKGIWGRNYTEIFAVGYYNQFKYFSEGNWQPLTLSEWHDYNGVYGNDKTVYAVGSEGTILSYENNKIVKHNTGTNAFLKDIWGEQETFYAVGENGTILCYTGVTWEQESHPLQNKLITFHGVWGADLSNVFVVGENNSILKYNGIQWTVMDTSVFSPNTTIYSIWGNNSDDFYISCSDGNLFQYFQRIWIEKENFGNPIYDIHGWNEKIVISGDDGIHFFDESWSKLETNTNNTLYGVWATGNKIFTVGTAGTQLELTGPVQNEEPSVKNYLLTINILPERSGEVLINSMLCNEHCQYTFSENDIIEIKANSMNGYFFKKWNGDLVEENSEIVIKMTSDKNIEAIFVKNNLTEKPDAIYPENGRIISDSNVTLIGEIYNDPYGNKRYTTYWKVREVDQPYNCPEFDTMFCHKSDSDSQYLTKHVLTDLIKGVQYAWMLGYQDIYSDNTLWSDENYFIVGELERDDNLKIRKGESADDYMKVSFVHWFQEPIGREIFGINLLNGYNPAIIRIGTYITDFGDYVEYYPNLWVSPGKSFWILSRVDIPISVKGVPVTTVYPVEIKLNFGKDGWNMISCPNRASYAWEKIQVICYDENGNPIDMKGNIISKDQSYFISELYSDNIWLNPVLWLWESGEYKQTDYLEPYRGYWIKVNQPNLNLRFIPEAQISPDHTRSKNNEKTDIETPPLPMNGFDYDVNGIGGGCFISVSTDT